jgi:hypothetical protein
LHAAAADTKPERRSHRLDDQEPPPFSSARQAMAFATRRAGGPLRPLMNRMGDRSSGGGAGLSGLDAAAQAGMVLNAVGGLGRLARACLVAGSAPRLLPCGCRRPCCCGRMINDDWRDAVEVVSAEAALRVIAIEMRSRELRSAVVVRIYSGREITFLEMGRRFAADPDTISKYHRALHAWLMGAPARGEAPAAEGVDRAAWREADQALRDRGIVG